MFGSIEYTVPADVDINLPLPLPVKDELEDMLQQEFNVFDDHGPYSKVDLYDQLFEEEYKYRTKRAPDHMPPALSIRDKYRGINEVQMLLSLIANTKDQKGRIMTLTPKMEGFHADISTVGLYSRNAKRLPCLVADNVTNDVETIRQILGYNNDIKSKKLGHLLSLKGELVIKEEGNGYDQLKKLFRKEGTATRLFIWDAKFELSENCTLATRLEGVTEILQAIGLDKSSPIKVVDFLELSLNDHDFDKDREWKWIKNTLASKEGIVAELHRKAPSDKEKYKIKYKFKIYFTLLNLNPNQNLNYADVIEHPDTKGKIMQDVKLTKPQTITNAKKDNQVHCYWGTNTARVNAVVNLNKFYIILQRDSGINLETNTQTNDHGSLEYQKDKSKPVFPESTKCPDCHKNNMNPNKKFIVEGEERCTCGDSDQASSKSPTEAHVANHPNILTWDEDDKFCDEPNPAYEEKVYDEDTTTPRSSDKQAEDEIDNSDTKKLQEILQLSETLAQKIPPMLQELDILKTRPKDRVVSDLHWRILQRTVLLHGLQQRLVVLKEKAEPFMTASKDLYYAHCIDIGEFLKINTEFLKSAYDELVQPLKNKSVDFRSIKMAIESEYAYAMTRERT